MLNLVLRTWPSRRTIRFSVIGIVCGVMTAGPTGGRTRAPPGASGPEAVEAVTGPGAGTSPAGLVISGGFAAASSGFAGGVTMTVGAGTGVVVVSASLGSGSLLTTMGSAGFGSIFGGSGIATVFVTTGLVGTLALPSFVTGAGFDGGS